SLAPRAPPPTQAPDASPPSVRSLPAAIDEDGEPTRLAPLRAFEPPRRSTPRQIERDAHQSANRGTHQTRIAAQLDVRCVAQDELHSALARFRFRVAARVGGYPIEPDARAAQAAHRP